jgi:SAM-dependent methyltransferase
MYYITFIFVSSYYIHNKIDKVISNNKNLISSVLMTKFIDSAAYGGRNIREEIYNEFDGTVLDMCSGIGFSTKPGNVGVDISGKMVSMSKILNPKNTYICGDVSTYGKNEEFDIVSIMFAFHEIPTYLHRDIIRNAIRVARRKVVVIDISNKYKPHNHMLSNEPYILDYLNNFENVMNNIIWKEQYPSKNLPINHIVRWNKKHLVDNYIDMWEYIKPESNLPTKKNLISEEEHIKNIREIWNYGVNVTK